MGLSNWIDDFFEGMKNNLTERALKKGEKVKLDPRLVEQKKKIKEEMDDYEKIMAEHK